MSAAYVLAYLAAIVAANLVVARFGPSVSVLTAFLLIGATLTLRDALHDRWQGRDLTLRMAALIVAGSALSWLASADAGRIAAASCVAFAVSEAADSVLYHRLRALPWMRRVTGSNVLGAAVDSVVFPLLAFGSFLWPVMLGQFVAKVGGGALWAWALSRRRRVAVAAAACAAGLLVLPGESEAQQARPPRFVVQAQAGTNHYPWNDYRPTGNVGANTIIFLPRGFSVLLVASRDVTKGAEWVGVAALQFRLWSR
jgi:uncharacterized PurR-regulated membrane protein YhhQ (DUF165 family)